MADTPALRPPLRVLLADPAPLQRAGLRALLTTPPAGHHAGPPPAAHPPAPPTGPEAPPPAAAQPPAPAPGPAHGSAAAPGPAHASAAAPGPAHASAAAPGPAHTPAPESAHARTSAPGTASAPPAASALAPASTPAPAFAPASVSVPAEIVIAGEAADGVEALDLARRLLPDVLIIELTLPRLDGLAVISAVAEAQLPVRILVVTDDDSDEQIRAAVAAGATGYLRKDAPHEELITAVRAVSAGGAVISPQLLARVLSRLVEAPPAPAGNRKAALNALTAREREVLTHVARGCTNAEIADLLQVSETTVKTHVGHVLGKLRLRDRTQAVVLAYETGLVIPGA